MSAQVNKILSTGYYNIKNISKIRKNLSKDDTKIVVNALVTSHLDNGNSLLYGIPKKYLNKLQVMQNSAARVVEKLRKFDSITEVRKNLHWLPVQARIEFKIRSFTWLSLNKIAPDYLQELLKEKQTDIFLRNKKDNLLQIPITNLSTYGDRAFEKVAPVLWNKIPLQIRQSATITTFKSQLKTHMFNQYYS